MKESATKGSFTMEREGNNNMHDFPLQYKNETESENIKATEILAKKYSLRNDSEWTYNYMKKLNWFRLINFSNWICSKLKHLWFKQAYDYFSLMVKINHPIAKYFLGIMKYKGEGCDVNQQESFAILKDLSKNEIIEDNF